MKKIIFFFAIILMGNLLFAQSEKYIKAMESLVPSVDTTRSPEGLTELANSFERIANAEKTEWLPNYYVALCLVNKASFYSQSQELDKIDPIMDKAAPFLQKALEISNNNSEVMCLKKMFNTGKMLADPQNRFMTLSMAAMEALEIAKSLDSENPRVYLLEGIDKYYTPEQWGGSKVEGKKLFEEALKKFESFKPVSSIHPNWGIGQTRYFLSLD